VAARSFMREQMARTDPPARRRERAKSGRFRARRAPLRQKS